MPVDIGRKQSIEEITNGRIKKGGEMTPGPTMKTREARQTMAEEPARRRRPTREELETSSEFTPAPTRTRRQ